jgi:hypothetical protein
MKTKKKSLKRARLLSKKEYDKFIKLKQKNKISKKQLKKLDHTLFIKYCKCIKTLKNKKKKKSINEYPICMSSVYTKRGFKAPKNVKKRCKQYKL